MLPQKFAFLAFAIMALLSFGAVIEARREKDSTTIALAFVGASLTGLIVTLYAYFRHAWPEASLVALISAGGFALAALGMALGGRGNSVVAYLLFALAISGIGLAAWLVAF